MLVGLTYDLKDEYLAQGFDAELVSECDSPVTINALEKTLRDLGYETERVGNLQSLVQALAQGKRWDVVFNIAEGLFGLLRESQIPALLDGYRIPYVFSDSFVLAVCLHKGMAKDVVAKAGVPTAPWQVVSQWEQTRSLGLGFPLFLKPVAGGTGIGISKNSKVSNQTELETTCRRLLAQYGQPVLVEPFLSGREFTVGIVGTGDAAQSVGVMEIVVDHARDGGIYSYASKQEYETCTRYEKPSVEVAGQCERVALGAWNALGCRDGGRVDLKMDGNGQVQFLEVNPLAGLHPIDSDLPILCRMHGLDYTGLLSRIMESATKRLGLCMS
ncbi:MAG: D-alanine--D-alanine ligase [Sphaerochaeta sp.]|uniref:D-alanine--D-alanine ligase family protein n=1 Tax=Sphaerochaeta sp. TaxID=1972642 RepID=UPI002FCBECCB